MLCDVLGPTVSAEEGRAPGVQSSTNVQSPSSAAPYKWIVPGLQSPTSEEPQESRAPCSVCSGSAGGGHVKGGKC